MKRRATRIALYMTAVIVVVVMSVPLLLYIPPVQQWLVTKAAAIASEATGLNITVGSVRLKFPLTLTLQQVEVTRSASDTIAIVERLDADVALMPLFSGRAEVNGITVSNAKVNTFDLISDTQIDATLGKLAINATTAQLVTGDVDVSALTLDDAAICVILSDTAAIDTTESEPLLWRVKLEETRLRNVSCNVRLPGDSMIVDAALYQALATNAIINLEQGRYEVERLDVENGAVKADQTFEPRKTEGMDYAHIDVQELNMTIDSIVYEDPSLSLAIQQASLKERCGLQIDELSAHVALDNLGIKLSSASLKTPFSSIFARADVAYSALSPSPTSASIPLSYAGGTASLNLDATIGRHDIELFAPVKGLPEWPLKVEADVTGTISNATINTLNINLPTVLNAQAKGTIGLDSLENITAVNADIDMKLQTQNTRFILSTLDLDKSLQIPSGMLFTGNLKADGQRYNADITARDRQATVKTKAMFDTKNNTYMADVDIVGLDVSRFVKDIDCNIGKAQCSVKGKGFDVFNKTTWLDANANIDSLRYGQWKVDSVQLTASLQESHVVADIVSRNRLADGTVGLDITLTPQSSNTNSRFAATIDLALLDMKALGVVEHQLDVALKGDITVDTNFKDNHKLSGLLKEIALTDSIKTHTPENLGVLIAARPDTTYLRVQNGNFIVKLDASGPYDQLLTSLSALADTIGHQVENRVIDQAIIKQMLPKMRLYVTSGRENAPANILKAAQNIEFQELLADITTSAENGVNGSMHIYKLNLDNTLIDSVLVNLKESDHGLTFQARMANEKNNPLTFTTLMDGHLYEHGARVGLRIFDQEGRLGLRLGTQASMENDGIKFTLLPSRPTLAFREFNLNDDNFIFLRNDLRLSAKVEMEDDDGTTIDVYSEDTDSTRLQDLTVSTAKLNLNRLTAILPFLPSVEGMLDGDFHIIMDQQNQISVAADVEVDNMVYEGNNMGKLNTEFVYLQMEDNSHAIDGILLRDGQQIASVDGRYINKKVTNGHESLDGQLVLVNTPLDIVNGFITDKIVGLEGYANGQFTMKGSLDALIVDGHVKFSDAMLFSTPYGMRMSIDTTTVFVEKSKLTLDNFKIFADTQQADTAAYMTITGNADFAPDKPSSINFRLRAREMQIINSRQAPGSLLFGKGFVSFMAMARGTMDNITVRGRIDVLGKTDITYLLLDSPLSTDNQMDELVKFTDFNDSTQTVVERPVPSSIDVNMTVNIDPGAHIRCGLNIDQSNYVDIFGGGELRLRMSQTEDMQLLGRYTLSSGTMKYSLPVIPLKTFTIQDGSYVEFTGKPDNPTLHITATERQRATVGQEGEPSRVVTFDCGVVVTKTLSDMGLQFIISAPEDITVQSELQSMTIEQRGKLAVTMLTTGMYLADGNTSGFSMNSALSSFLQSEINNIAGNALSTLDVSLGVDNTTDASGNAHTDYSFQFAKRFWNNRLKVQIGGKVSSGQEAQANGQKQSFFDNVSMEYRLAPTGNQYLKMFYMQNVYDWLDGYTSEYGAGYIYKRKMNHWWEAFQLWRKK